MSGDQLDLDADGCCTSCAGTGYGGPGSGPETNGRCSDCRGDGCAHEGSCRGPLSADELDMIVRRDKTGWNAAGDVPALVAELRRLRALPDLTLGWDSSKGVMVFTDPSTAQRVTLREWIGGP